jgi:hypothetical protein
MGTNRFISIPPAEVKSIKGNGILRYGLGTVYRGGAEAKANLFGTHREPETLRTILTEAIYIAHLGNT